MTLLKCSKCKKEKPPSEFSKDKNRKSGYYPICKECEHARQKEYRIKNREKLIEKSKEYYNNNKQKVLDRCKKYYYNNIEEIHKKKIIYCDKPIVRLRSVYGRMIRRCNDENVNGYQHYGGRGIKCLRNSFEEFYNDMYESFIKQSEKYGTTDMKYVQLDRIDCNGNYCKENCRWVTAKENSNNRRKQS